MCTQQLPELHSINNLLTQKFPVQRSTLFLLFKNYSLVEVIHLGKTHTPHTENNF